MNIIIFLTMVKVHQHRYQHYCIPHYGEGTINIVMNIIVFLTMVKVPSASLSTLLSSSLW